MIVDCAKTPVQSNHIDMNDDLLNKLERLARLKEQGALTEAEFERQKAELMGSTPKAAPTPNVPEKKKSKASGCIMVIVALILLGVITRLTGSGDNSASGADSTSTAYTPEPESRSKKVQGFFSPYDGSHRGLEKSIKSSMNDPDSYDHVETRYRDDSTTILVTTKFRGKNAFGGVIVNYAKGKLDGQTGELLEWEFIKE